MSSSATEQLTDNQRECLRLVLTHHSSKEIAALLGISASAVDKRLERAVITMGASSRFEAARKLHLLEQSTWERTPSEPIDVPITPSSAPPTVQDEPLGLVRRFQGQSPGSGGRARNRFGVFGRLAAIIVLAVMLAIGSMALLNEAVTFTEFTRHLR